jgi:GNAT superfamily N-acetyltransferase
VGDDDAYRLRPATIEDIPVLAAQRCAMFTALDWLEPGATADLERAVVRYLERALPAGEFRAWVIESTGQPDGQPDGQPGGQPVAGGGVQLRPLVPRPGHLDGQPEALVLSVWTDPAHRRRGLATRLMEAILTWCRAEGIRRVTLHASDAGRSVYERLGFRPTNEMRLELED